MSVCCRGQTLLLCYWELIWCTRKPFAYFEQVLGIACGTWHTAAVVRPPGRRAGGDDLGHISAPFDAAAAGFPGELY